MACSIAASSSSSFLSFPTFAKTEAPIHCIFFRQLTPTTEKGRKQGGHCCRSEGDSGDRRKRAGRIKKPTLFYKQIMVFFQSPFQGKCYNSAFLSYKIKTAFKKIKFLPYSTVLIVLVEVTRCRDATKNHWADSYSVNER